MKAIIQKIIQFRNPDFKFDPQISGSTLRDLMKEKLGEFLRGLHFAGKGKGKLFIGRGVQLFDKKKIRFGKWNKIGSYVRISGLGKEGVLFGDNVSIGDFSRVICSTSFNHLGSFIKIGNNVGIGEYAYLGGAGGLEIGDDCIIGQYLSCHPENHNYEDADKLIRSQGVNRQGIKIGKNCWIGAKVTILDGVSIGDNCIIAAGAVVNKSFPDNVIIGGVPAKVLKQKNNNLKRAI